MNEKIKGQILKMVEEVESKDWKQPWISRAKCNFITGRPYHGGNAALVAMQEEEFFLTFKQSKEIGFVKKGSSGLPIAFYKMVKDKEDEKKTRHFQPFLKLRKHINILKVL